MNIPQLDVLAFLKQFTQWQMKYPLSVDDYRWATYPMRAALLTGTTTGSVTQRIPNTHIALVYSIHAFVRITDLSAESLAISAVGNPTFKERLALKANNCKFDFKIADGDVAKFVEGASALQENLGSLHPAAGGEPYRYNPPMIVDGGKTLQLDLSLEDTAADVVGSTTLYGVGVRALLVRRQGN